MTVPNDFTIGRNCEVVLVWNGSTIDLGEVTGFQSQQEVKTQRSDPLNAAPIEFNTPSGWRGSFSLDRANPVLDELIASIESQFWQGGIIGSGTIYQYIVERDGTTSCYEFVGVSLTYSAAGSYVAENVVKQTLGFFASLRNKV